MRPGKLVRLDEVQIASRAFNHERIRIRVVILAAKLAMVHEPEIHAGAGGLIERGGHGNPEARNDPATFIARAGVGDVGQVRGHGQVGLQLG